MFFVYGDYTHALNEAGLAISAQTQFSSQGVEQSTRYAWSLTGYLQAETQAELTTAIEAMQAAYNVHGCNAGLYFDVNSPTAHQVNSSQTIGGVRVSKKPSFQEWRGGEYSTFRSYALELEFDLPPQSLVSGFLEWEETLSFSGGGPRWLYLPTLNGLPVRQQVQEYTAYRVTQTGRAVGQFAYPLPNYPIWPQAWHQDQGGIMRKAPTRLGGGTGLTDVNYEVTWSYEFESALPLAGLPSPRPA